MAFDEAGLTLDSTQILWRHAFDDSDEEEEQISNKEELFDVSPTEIETADTLVCCIGTFACDYARNYLLAPESKVSSVISSKSPSKILPKHVTKSKEGPINLSQLYSQPQMGRVVVLHETELNAGLELQWAKKVLELTKPTSVVVLTSKPHLEHLSDKRPPPPFLRSLASSAWNVDCMPACPLLDTPNFIQGETAALLTLCEHGKIGGLVIICYYSRSDRVEAVKAFHCQGLTGSYLRLGKDNLPSDSELTRNIHKDSSSLASVFT